AHGSVAGHRVLGDLAADALAVRSRVVVLVSGVALLALDPVVVCHDRLDDRAAATNRSTRWHARHHADRRLAAAPAGGLRDPRLTDYASRRRTGAFAFQCEFSRAHRVRRSRVLMVRR